MACFLLTANEYSVLASRMNENLFALCNGHVDSQHAMISWVYNSSDTCISPSSNQSIPHLCCWSIWCAPLVQQPHQIQLILQAGAADSRGARHPLPFQSSATALPHETPIPSRQAPAHGQSSRPHPSDDVFSFDHAHEPAKNANPIGIRRNSEGLALLLAGSALLFCCCCCGIVSTCSRAALVVPQLFVLMPVRSTDPAPAAAGADRAGANRDVL